jgi:polysaccharide biosynthesis protein PslG
MSYRTTYPMAGFCINNEFLTTPSEMDMMKDAGFDFIRVGAWFGRSNTSLYQTMENAVSKGMRLHILLSCGETNWRKLKYDEIKSWLKWVGHLVEDFKREGAIWEVWNEPDLQQFWPDPRPQEWAWLFNETAREIRAASREEWIVGPAISPTGLWGDPQVSGVPNWRTQWKRVPSEYVSQMDAFSIHPYSITAGQIPSLYQEIREATGKKLLVGEVGWSTNQMSEAAQSSTIAAFKTASLADSAANGDYPYFCLYKWKAEGDAQEAGYGIVQSNLTPKQAYTDLVLANPN